jgi:hypothetical protein
LKSTRIKQLFEQYHTGQFHVSSESFPLWHALAVRWEYQRNAELNLAYEDTQRLLNSLLRLPALHAHIVNREGKPFVRVAEPLRWQLQPAATSEDDYRLELAAADGTPIPPVLVALPGRPSLYVTDHAIYPGPPPFTTAARYAAVYGTPAAILEQQKSYRLSVPAPALESRHGVDLLTRLGVELPERLKERVRVATMNVKLCCDLRAQSAYSTTEYIFIRIMAQASVGKHTEEYTVGGWAKSYRKTNADLETEKGMILQYDRRTMADIPELLVALGPQWSHQDGCWRMRAGKDFPEKFVPWLQSLPKHIEVLLDRELATLMNEPVHASVRLDVTPAGVDWFDLEVVVDVGNTELTPEELKALLNARGGYVRFGKNGWRRLAFDLSAEDDERLARLGLSARDFSGEPQRLHALQLADEAAARFLPAEQVAEVRRRAEELQTRVTPPVPAEITGQLRPYQIEGFHFLCYLSTNRFGGILADDMGLGKTLQTLAWLAWLRGSLNGTHRPSLVVCPKSVMDNWRAESERFLSGLRVRLWSGTDVTRLETALAEADLFVVNYTQLRLLGDALAKREWLAAILDEGQYIKNPASQTARVACSLKAEHRLVLTGTPIENRLLDLWSLFGFAMPGVLGNRNQFAKRYDQADDPLARRRLSGRVRPFLLRRTKSQVAKDLPDRVEEDLLCEMEGAQLTLYRAEFKSAQQILLKIKTASEFDRQRFNFLHSLLRLRQLCCHPALVDPKQATASSAKIEAWVELLEPLIEEGHKVLVFSQFVSLLDLLKPIVREKNWPHFVLTGETENRGALVAEFQATKGPAVFLISLKAGGFGLNLTAASYVVLFDPWWNPAVENQAIDRTHRIGQTSKVIAYRLLIKNSIEEKIRTLQRNKRTLAEDILGEEKLGQSLTLDDLRFLFADA